MGQTMSTCIGFAPHEGTCDREADTPAGLWCHRCEDLRRVHISTQFEAIHRQLQQGGLTLASSS